MLLDDVAARGRTFAELRRAGEEDGTAVLQARIAVRQAVRDAWAEGIEQVVQLSTLADLVCPTPSRSRPPDGNRCCSTRSTGARAGVDPRRRPPPCDPYARQRRPVSAPLLP
ncbi:hypothetical protein [Streptomyces sp. NPDC085540]|uniref:hypothetical protein n=1 Tax=Streptomyces sp. NPDC085540 TaxID=3365730 RepID=UPI0037D752DB